MWQVTKSFWKILVGVKDALALLFLLIFFWALFALLNSSPNPAAAARDGALLLKLDGTIAEQPAEVDPFDALLATELPEQQTRARDIIRSLDLAVKDDRVKAVVLDMERFLGGGQTTLADIGERLDKVKKAGKPVYAYATAYTDDSYQLAAHATEIWVDPLGGAILTGPGGSRLYYKGLMDQLGVKAHVYRVGTFKSAVEPYLRNDQSPEAKEALTAVYDEMWGQWREGVAKARPQAQIDALLTDPAAAVEGAKGDLAALALSNKLVDKLGDRIAFGKHVAAKVGKDDDEKSGGFAAMPMDALLAAHGEDSNGERIGVVTVAGEIVDGEGGPGTAHGDTIAKLIYDAIDKGDLKALVVRVDSPGGSVMASERIRLALEAAKQKKLPVVVSMANLAASGGYWVSTPADAILAEPSTITGSIGIFGVLPSFETALGKWGVTADGVKTTKLSGEPDVMGGVSEDFNRVAQSVVEKGYRDFLTRVATSRKKTPEQVDAIAQGRVWAGGTARQLGLVDGFGGLDEALAKAASLAKLEKDDWHPVWIEPQSDFANSLIGGLLPKRGQAVAPMDLFAHAAWQQQALLARVQADLKMLSSVQGAQVRCLECGAFGQAPVVQARGDTGWLALLARLTN